MFHAGAEYSSRPNDVVRSLVKAGLPIGDGNVINFSDTCNIKWQTLMQYSAILLFSMETRSKVDISFFFLFFFFTKCD